MCLRSCVSQATIAACASQANMALFDAGIKIWQEKERADAVRPFTAIHREFGDDIVRAWGGPGMGTRRIPGSQWKSYLEEADHPEYPSASACFCAAQAQAIRKLYDTDELGYAVEFPQGSSRVEPGITPSKTISKTFATWSEFVNDCG